MQSDLPTLSLSQPTDLLLSLHHPRQIFLEPAPLLPSISLLANLSLTCLRRTSQDPQFLVPTLLLYRDNLLARHLLNQSGRIVFPVQSQMLKVNCQTHLQLVFMLRKGTCLKTRMQLSQTRTNLSLRNRLTERVLVIHGLVTHPRFVHFCCHL